MKRLSLITLLFLTIHILFSQTVIPPGDVSGSWTLAGSPYNIEGEIKIPEGSLLTVEPGVDIIFQGHYKFIVEGKLLALGELNDTITFTVNDTIGFHDKETPNGGWFGLRINRHNQSDTTCLQYCKFEYGKAVGEEPHDKYGGAIHTDASSYFTNRSTISNCLFQNNLSYYSGSAICFRSSSYLVNNCKFYNNFGGGTASLLGAGNIILSNNLIQNNSGAGISGDSYYATIVNNVITDNNGPGLCFGDCFGSLVVNNTICNNHTNDDGVGGIYVVWNSTNPLLFYNNIIYGNSSSEGSQISMKYSVDNFFYNNNIEGGFENIEGNNCIAEYENNIDTDPFFENTMLNDYNLHENSPCINAGIPDTSGLFLPIFDIKGNQRIYDNSVIDMGAYEFQGEPNPYPEIGIISPSIEFGIITQNEKSMEHAFRICNYGHAPLEVDITAPLEFTIKPEGDSFFVQELPSLIIPPKSDTTIYVIFLPTDILIHVDSIIILSNDLDNPVRTVTLSGEGTNLQVLEGNISNDSTICANRILINNNVVIEPDAKLTICNGSSLEFLNNYSFTIYGILNAIGETGDSIAFKTCKDVNFVGDSIIEKWGGFFFENDSPMDSSILSHCIIENAYKHNEGAISITNCSKLSIKNCEIKNNEGAGIFCYNNSSPLILKNKILNNGYAGVHCESNSNAIISGNVISYSSPGINVNESSPYIISNTVSFNSYAGVNFHYNSNSIVANNLIIGNTCTSYTGGLSFFHSGSNIEINNNTIAENTPNGLNFFESSPVLQNNIIYNNYKQARILSNPCNPDFYFCNMEGGLDSLVLGNNTTYNGNYFNNIDAEPLFLNEGMNSFMLTSNSPCIDMGNPDTTGTFLSTTDIAGNPRIFNDRIDIGAYEFGIYPPYFTSLPILYATVDEEYYYEVSAEDFEGSQLEFNFIALSDWLTFNSSDTNFAQLSGIPQVGNIGESDVEITVSNSYFQTTQSFTINITLVGFMEHTEKLFELSPNPTSGKFYITTTDLKYLPCKIDILSYNGNKLKSYLMLNKELIINAKDLPKGLYFIRIEGMEKIEVKKIILH